MDKKTKLERENPDMNGNRYNQAEAPRQKSDSKTEERSYD